jgi:hypothetical protein
MMLLALAGSAHAQAVQFGPAPGGEIIVDPELEASKPAAAPPPETTIAAPSEQSADVRLVLRSRVGIDLEWQDAREDVVEATQLMLLEARVRRSETLAFTVGVRALHRTLTRERSTADADAVRYELEAAPTAVHVDVGVTDTVNTRLGYQGVHLGRFDVLGTADVLSRYDLRSGPTVMPEASEIAQPAISADWDITQGVALRGTYVPFFGPHMINAFDGDYALPLRQADVDNAFDFDLDGPLNIAPRGEQVLDAWRSAFSRSGQARLAEGAFTAFAPDPNLGSPQAGLRLTAHGPEGEIALTAATALEKLPTLSEDAAGMLRIHYGRYGLLALDAATAVGPVQLGVEIAYTTDRPLVSVDPALLSMDKDGTWVRESDILHTAIRAELVEGDEWLVAVEASCATMLADPPNDLDWHSTVERRYQLAAVGFVGYSISSIDLRLELGGGALVGPTYLITPRAELRLWDQLYGEVGAQIIGGKGSSNWLNPSATLGSLYDDIDQVLVGLRWLI